MNRIPIFLSYNLINVYFLTFSNKYLSCNIKMTLVTEEDTGEKTLPILAAARSHGNGWKKNLNGPYLLCVPAILETHLIFKCLDPRKSCVSGQLRQKLTSSQTLFFQRKKKDVILRKKMHIKFLDFFFLHHNFYPMTRNSVFFFFRP